MKMVLAIVNHDDAHAVVSSLTQGGFKVTKLSTTGGLLRVGNDTLLIGVEDEKLETVLGLIKQNSKSRRQVIPTTSEFGMGFYSAMPVEVTVGGATVFVLSVDRFETL